VNGYEPFVFAFNNALQELRKIKVPLREPTDRRILFHRNDPKEIRATHNGHPSTRKPDIVLVFLETAQNAFAENDSGCWEDFAFKTASNPPNEGFSWDDCLSVGEFKRTSKRLARLPAKYKYKEVSEIAPQVVPKVTPAQFAWPDESMEKLPSAQLLCKPLLTNILIVHE